MPQIISCIDLVIVKSNFINLFKNIGKLKNLYVIFEVNMPTYTYNCKNCGHEFTEIRKLSEREIPINSPCPECGQDNCISQSLSSFLLGDPFIHGSPENRKPPKDFKEGILDRVKKQPGKTTEGRLSQL